MKKLLVVLMVLTMATIANAGLTISVNGEDNPQTPITLLQSQTAMIDVHSDGLELADAPAFIVVSGPGVVDITGAVNYFNPPGYDSSIFMWSGTPLEGDGVFIDTASSTPGAFLPAGVIADGIIFHCEGLGDVTLSLYMDRGPNGGTFQLMDTQVISQIIPEPITVALLGLGGLFLRRRK